MGKKLISEERERGTLEHICGAIQFLTVKESVACASLTLNTPKGKSYVTVFFHGKMYERAKRALKEGRYVHLVVFPLKEDTPAKDGTPRYTTGAVDFNFETIRRLKIGEAEKNILIGTVRRITPMNKGGYIATIPVKQSYNQPDSHETTAWYSVIFKNNASLTKPFHDEKIKVGDRICILAGSVYDTEYNGRVYHNLDAEACDFYPA